MQRNRYEDEEIILLIHFTNMQLQAGNSSRKRHKVCYNSVCILCGFPSI